MDSQAILNEFLRRLGLMFYMPGIDALTLNKDEAIPNIIVDGIPM